MGGEGVSARLYVHHEVLCMSVVTIETSPTRHELTGELHSLIGKLRSIRWLAQACNCRSAGAGSELRGGCVWCGGRGRGRESESGFDAEH